jgi:hypothetical protein
MTILAAVAFAILQTLETTGVIPVGALESITTCGKSVAGLLTVFGLRRAISANGLGVIFGDDSDPDLDEDPEDYELTDEDFDEPGEGEDLGDFAYDASGLDEPEVILE